MDVGVIWEQFLMLVSWQRLYPVTLVIVLTMSQPGSMSTESEDDQSDRPGASYQASYQTAISSACHALVEKEKCSCETEKLVNDEKMNCKCSESVSHCTPQSGMVSCLCCIQLECSSNSSSRDTLLPQHKGLSKLEGMLHKLVLSSGIKHSLNLPKSFVPPAPLLKNQPMDNDLDFSIIDNAVRRFTANQKMFLENATSSFYRKEYCSSMKAMDQSLCICETGQGQDNSEDNLQHFPGCKCQGEIKSCNESFCLCCLKKTCTSTTNTQ